MRSESFTVGGIEKFRFFRVRSKAAVVSWVRQIEFRSGTTIARIVRPTMALCWPVVVIWIKVSARTARVAGYRAADAGALLPIPHMSRLWSASKTIHNWNLTDTFVSCLLQVAWYTWATAQTLNFSRHFGNPMCAYDSNGAVRPCRIV